ncbi:hypothetical protein V9T40_001434 [Parthenolecanium corni]|uniref:Uncharacterized protein n=1 Tax=Parthenolecanium corni TaxID=536013 RepID=A0AAN9TM85_9HEMI
MADSETTNALAPLINPLKDISSKISKQDHPVGIDGKVNTITQQHLQAVKAGSTDKSYGLFCVNDKFYMGDTEIVIGDNYLQLPNNRKYILTEGLWHLLTSRKPDRDLYDENDFNMYSELVEYTNVHFLKNNPETKKPKSNGGPKYKQVVKKIYENSIHKNPTDKDKYKSTPVKKTMKGKGLTKIVNTEDHNTENQGNMSKDYIERRDRKIANEFLPKPVAEGKGLINSLIDNLPVPLHLPGYNYAGPGTPLDLHLERGVKPINKLDEAAMKHDIAYSRSDALKQRHDADYVLQEEAWQRVKADDSSLGEKANAWLVTNAMKVKRAIGAGVSKPRYTEYPANLDEQDLEKLKKAASGRNGVSITLRCNRTKESIGGDIHIPLTAKQIRGVKAAHAKQKDAKIRLTGAQLKTMATTEGGFLPALLAAVPAIAAVGSLITQGVTAYNNKKANDKLVEERKRHNKVLESAATGKTAEGEGVVKKKKVPLTNFDIVKIVKTIKMPYFRGVYMRDGLPAKPKLIERAVVNLDSSTGRGTHWVCYSKNGNKVEYFDSFGVEPPQDLIEYFGKNAKISYNSEQIQKLDQIICGHLCLEWLNGLDEQKRRMLESVLKKSANSKAASPANVKEADAATYFHSFAAGTRSKKK